MSILTLENITKSFGGIRAVDCASLKFEKGSITAIIGSNGAGKTTLFNLISGFLSPDEGRILYQKRDIAGLSAWHIARLGIGRLFQDTRIFNRMTVKDNLLLAFNQKGENPFSSVFARWKVIKEEQLLAEQTINFLEIVGLAGKAEELAENLSYGQQKLLAIARLLATDSRVLLLDEPTSGVSPQMVDELLNIIRKLAREGKTIIITEHNIPLVNEISDWAYFMSGGKVIASGPSQIVLNDPEIRATYIGV